MVSTVEHAGQWTPRTNETTTAVTEFEKPQPPGVTRIALTISAAKPMIFLHVGPHKTATTSLQCTLARYRSLLHQDGILFVGKTNPTYCPELGTDLEEYSYPLRFFGERDCHKTINDAIANGRELMKVQCFHRLDTSLREYSTQGKHLIYSEELWTNFHIYSNDIHKYVLNLTAVAPLLKKYFDVHIIVGYRRYFQWISSCKAQLDKPLPNRQRWLQWPGNDTDGRAYESTWAQIRNKKIRCGAFTPAIVEGYKVLGDVHVLNMHGEENYLTDLVCNVLPAPITCAARRQEDLSLETIHNPSSVSIFYDMLAVHAARLGYFATFNKKRWEVADQARQFWEATKRRRPTDLPLTCPIRSELNFFLLKKSLRQEKDLLPAFFHSSLGEPQHIEDFWKAVNKSAYCNVNVEAALNQTDWVNFFRKLDAAATS